VCCLHCNVTYTIIPEVNGDFRGNQEVQNNLGDISSEAKFLDLDTHRNHHSFFASVDISF